MQKKPFKAPNPPDPPATENMPAPTDKPPKLPYKRRELTPEKQAAPAHVITHDAKTGSRVKP